MKIKEGFSLIKTHGENVIVCDNSLIKDFSASIVLGETSVFLWNLIKNSDNINKENMLKSLLENYDISTVLALNNIDVFVKTLEEHGILEE